MAPQGGVGNALKLLWRALCRWVPGLAALALLGLGGLTALAQQPNTRQLQIVGGLAGVSQYVKFEQPFWQKEIAERSGGRITATIRPLDSGSLRSQEMLQLMRLGVVPFGTALLSVVAGEQPELNAVDLPVLNPDMATLRRTVAAFRPYLEKTLRERYDIELLGIYTYPAQVLFCTRAFSGLGDLTGRKVRTSSVGQSELMAALGAVPVQTPFAQIVSALRGHVADCAITGTLSGYEIGLRGAATHVHAMAISWGVSMFGANRAAWASLPAEAQETIRAGVADLETRIWTQAEADTLRGLVCNVGAQGCPDTPEGGPGGPPMTLVPTSEADAARRRELLTTVVLPRWIERCGQACARAWDATVGPVHAIRVPVE